MPEKSRYPLRRGTAYAVISMTATVGIALLAATPAMAAVSPASFNALAPDNESLQLDALVVPAAPEGCSAAQLRERARQVQLLEAEKAAEVRVIETVTDGSQESKLGAIRQRADIIVGRIERLDAQCDGAGEVPAPPPAPGPAPAPAPDVEGGPLVALEIECAEVDFTGVDAAAAARAATELAANEEQLDTRLDSDFPRFSARVAREADPERARAEFRQLAENLAGTLEARRGAILDRADGGNGLADEFARTCEVVNG